ncbi:MFS transporter [Brachybacterium kimchii]|uniref:MFS transporter n=1 Tax=Brachybacterium kimchii TaxID=2942909 RepID=A0ABY4N9L2_9MICO|nr:MFS transporter [Brachybacterium kimchii]UQN30804.1 MFS transporter [Brachybacterium kimchii]
MSRYLIPASALVGGLQLALLNPVIALLLSALFGADPGQVGLVLAIMNASGFLAALVIPAWADRRRDYAGPMILCAALTLATVLSLAATTSLTVAGIVLVVLAGPAGVWSGMLFALQRSEGSSSEQVVRTRAVFSVAWVAGPPLATGVMTGFGDRAVLLLIAAVALGSLALSVAIRRSVRRAAARTGPAEGEDARGRADGTGTGRAHGRADDADDGAAAPRRPARRLELVVVVLAITALQAGNAGSVTAMPLLVTEHLHLATVWAGVALGVCAALEAPALLLLGRLTRTIRPTTLLTAGALLAALYYALVPLMASPAALVALQIPNALGIAALTGVGLAWMQEAIDRPGLASGVYLNSRRAGAILTGPLLALAALGASGYGLTFWAFALLAALAALAIRLVGGREEAPSAR